MPKRSIQRGILRPTNRISITGRVLKLVGRSVLAGVEGGKGVDIRIPGVGVVDVEGGRIDFVEAEAAVEICERRYARADPTGSQGVCGRLDRAVLGVVDHHFVFVGVPEEDTRDDVGGVAVDDLVEEVGRVRKRIGTVPAGEDVAEDPDTLFGIFGGLQLLDHEAEGAGGVGIRSVDEIEEVTTVPEVGVESDDAQAVLVLDGISSVMEFGLVGSLSVNPAIVFPEIGDVVVAPAELLAERTRKLVGSVNGFRVGVVVAEDSEHGSCEVLLEHLEDALLGIFYIGTGQLILSVMRNEITGIF